MKFFLPLLTILVIVILIACAEKKNETVVQSNNYLDTMINQLNSRFTDTASYQSIIFAFDTVMGDNILVKVVKDIDSAKIQEWFYIGGKWNLTSESEFKSDSLKFSECVFKPKSDYQFSKLSSLLNVAAEKLKLEKKVENFTFKSINLLMDKRPTLKNKMENLITQIAIETSPEEKEYLINFDNKGNFNSINE